MASRLQRWRLSTVLCSLLAVISPVMALSNAYCSPQNTGGDLALQSIYMSMGLCFDTCNANYAFAILQDDNCWCSDYIPSDQVSTGDCNVECPGYPDDLCGNSAQDLFGYVKLSKAAAGTIGASSSSRPATTSPTSQEPGTTPPPTTRIQTVTQQGSVRVQTLVITPAPAPSSVLGTSKKDSGLSGGLIAAAVVASVLGLALIGAIIFFVLRRRRNAANDSHQKYGDINDDPSSPSNLNRNISTHSKAGLLERAYPPTIATTRMSRVSSTNGPEMSSSGAISPVTPNSERRQSRLVMYDSRLNPNSLMIIDNGSHTSLNTLDDHRDYGRMLKVVNPDANSNRPSMSRGRSNE